MQPSDNNAPKQLFDWAAGSCSRSDLQKGI